MRFRSKSCIFYFLIGVILGPCRGICSRVPLSETAPLILSKVTPSEDSEKKISKQDIAKFIPLDLKPSGDSSLIANRIADQSLNSWLNSSEAQSISLVRTAKNVEETMKTEVAFTSRGEKEINHRVLFQYQPFQSLANIRYKGLLSAEVNHCLSQETTELKVSETILQDKELSIQYLTGDHIGSRSMIGLGWRW